MTDCGRSLPVMTGRNRPTAVGQSKFCHQKANISLLACNQIIELYKPTVPAVHNVREMGGAPSAWDKHRVVGGGELYEVYLI